MVYSIQDRRAQGVNIMKKNKALGLDRLGRFGLMAAACLCLAACSTTQAQKADGGEVYDPLEDVNRTTYAVNDAVDKVLLEPVAKGYRAVVPKMVRTSVHNFLTNLKMPVNAANQLLQGDIEGVAHDISRTMINTTIGIGGLFDVAASAGLEHEPEDFGQTLAVWGVGHGPYLVLPFIGPSSVRDGVGMLVDSYADPLRLYLHNTDQDEWHYVRLGATILDTREQLIDVLDDLRKNSIDPYAAMRSAYMQRREALVRDEKPDEAAAPAIPDYDEVSYLDE